MKLPLQTDKQIKQAWNGGKHMFKYNNTDYHCCKVFWKKSSRAPALLKFSATDFPWPCFRCSEIDKLTPFQYVYIANLNGQNNQSLTHSGDYYFGLLQSSSF